MKHIRKIMSAILALTLVLTSSIVPTMAYGSATQGTTTDLEPGLIGDPDGNGPDPDYWEQNEDGEWVLKENAKEETSPVETSAVTEVVPCKYDGVDVDGFSEGLAAVELDGKWGFIDKTGKEVVPPKYDEVCNFSEGLAAVELNGKWGFIDKAGKEVVPCKYDGVNVDGFSEGLAMVALVSKEKQNSDPVYKWGFIDTTGKEVVPCKYRFADNFSEGLAMVRVGDPYASKCGFIDKTGKEVVPCKYDGVDNFSEGLAGVRLDGKFGFIDTTGKEIVPCKYNYVNSFSEGLAVVLLDEFGIIDTTGKEIVPLGKYNYTDSPKFHDGLAAVRLDGKFGFIDTTGKEIVPCKYDGVGNFSEGLAAVSLDDKYGFIDTMGQEIIPLKYDSVNDFSEGLAAVCAKVDSGKKGWQGKPVYEARWGFIDTTGKEIVPLGKYDRVENFSDGLAAVELNGKWGFISVSGAAAPVQTAKENVQTVKVDGKDVSFAMYSPDGGGTNYVRLVDLAVALNGTAGQYNVSYDGRVLLTSHTPYNGGTSTAPFHEPMTYTTLDEPTYVDGVAQNLDAIRFEFQGGGYTYYKLRDLGQALGFNVGWDNATQRIYIESDKPYDPNN